MTSPLTNLIESLISRAEESPAWLRPGMYGLLFIFGFMLARGGLLVLPVALLVLVIADLDQAMTLALALFIVVPLVGFAAGLVYGLVRRLTPRLGTFSRYPSYVSAALVYCFALVFLLMPWLEPETAGELSLRANIILATALGCVFGIVLAAAVGTE